MKPRLVKNQPSWQKRISIPFLGCVVSLVLLSMTLHLYVLLQPHATVGTSTFFNKDSPMESTKKSTQISVNSFARPQTRQINSWKSVNILDFGAIGDNATDNTQAIRNAIASIQTHGRGQVVIPKNGVFLTGPFNLTSNMVLKVEGTLFSIPNQDLFPQIAILPSYQRDYDFKGSSRRQALVNAVDETNITITGTGTIDGGGWYWYPCFKNHTQCHGIGRPHLMELQNCTNVEITGVTLKDSAFWTLHPVYCTNVHIHHVNIQAPNCRLYQCPNTDGIDVDSCENVLIEHNVINVGDDHVTVIAGRERNKNRKGAIQKPSRNVTIRYNTLLSGMGLSIGSGTAGGVEHVVFHDNEMTQVKGQRGQGFHIKTRTRFGGYVRNIAFVDNVFHVAGKPGGVICIEQGYQSGKAVCDVNKCTEISNIVISNLTVYEGNPGYISCFENKPCTNVTLNNIRFVNRLPKRERLDCGNVVSGFATNSYPSDLLKGCPNMTRRQDASSSAVMEDVWDYHKMIKR